jgi:uncharacterized protein YjbJ (UPF0337 family)
MSIEGKMNATAKDGEGKAQEAIGNLTGDKKLQAEGKAKQVQASAMEAADNLKDAAKNALDNLKDVFKKD